MQTRKRRFIVNPREISYIQTTLEAYDGMAMVRTVQGRRAVIEVSVAPGCMELVEGVLDSLVVEESLYLVPLKDQVETEKKRRPEMKPRYYIRTMGCQMNVYDSDRMAQILIGMGWESTTDPGAADLVLINTCTVRQKPEQKAYSLIGRMSKLKRRRPRMGLGVTGCLAQRIGPELLHRFPEVDFLLGPREIGRLPEAVGVAGRGGKKLVATDLAHPPCKWPGPLQSLEKTGVSAFVSIMEGCNNFCAYCVVPYVRGREISRDPPDIRAEITDRVQHGAKEVVLLGQNVNSYRFNDCTFPNLLSSLQDISGLERIRFTTSHPKDLSDALIECFDHIPKLCPHIHLPFQAGADSVLRRMNRRYTREQYMDLIHRLREVRPDIAVTADVMVGFPGERDADFEQTLDLVQRVQFDGLYSFKYSDRSGTPAARMPEKVSESNKTRRLNTLQALQRDITLAKNRAMEGRTVEVLVEGASRKGGQLSGRSANNKVVNFFGDPEWAHTIVPVRIQQGCMNSLKGIVPD